MPLSWRERARVRASISLLGFMEKKAAMEGTKARAVSLNNLPPCQVHPAIDRTLSLGILTGIP